MSCESEWEAVSLARQELDELWPTRGSADAAEFKLRLTS